MPVPFQVLRLQVLCCNSCLPRHVLLQFSCCRAIRSHRGYYHQLLWTSRANFRLICLQSRLLFHSYLATPRCGQPLLDAVDFEIWTKTSLSIKLYHVHNLLYLGWRCKDIHERTGSEDCNGICCWIWRMFGTSHDCRYFLPPSTRHDDGVGNLSLKPSCRILKKFSGYTLLLFPVVSRVASSSPVLLQSVTTGDTYTILQLR